MVVLDFLMEPPQNRRKGKEGREGKEEQVGKKQYMEATKQTPSKGSRKGPKR